MTDHTKIEMEIDEALRRLGSAEPAAGLAQRVNFRLQTTPRRFAFSVTRSVAAGALAAGVALTAALLNPTVRSLVVHPNSSAHSAPIIGPPRIGPPRIAPLAGFGTASAVHVPVEPVPVQPTPVNQGRGRSRSGRSVLPPGSVAPLPRGVTPHAPVTAIPASTTEPSQ